MGSKKKKATAEGIEIHFSNDKKTILFIIADADTKELIQNAAVSFAEVFNKPEYQDVIEFKGLAEYLAVMPRNMSAKAFADHYINGCPFSIGRRGVVNHSAMEKMAHLAYSIMGDRWEDCLVS